MNNIVRYPAVVRSIKGGIACLLVLNVSAHCNCRSKLQRCEDAHAFIVRPRWMHIQIFVTLPSNNLRADENIRWVGNGKGRVEREGTSR